MSKAEELALQADLLTDRRLESDAYEWSVDADVQLRWDAAELRRLSAVEAELEALKKAISEAEPVAEIAVTDSNVGGVWATVWRTSLPAGEYKLYTLKGIK